MRSVRQVAFGLMFLVTAWSFWAWAEPTPPTAGARSSEVVGESEQGPPAVNWLEFGKGAPPFVAMVVNFGILAAGYYLIGKKPIAAALQSRRDSIAQEIEEAQQMRREAELRAKTYQAKLDRLEEEVRTTREALLRAGEAERDRLLAEAAAQAERMRRDAEFLVEQEIKQVRQDLFRDTVDAAISAAEELLRKRVTGSDQERLAEDYLADLGGKPRSERSAESIRPAEPGARNSS
jgi:F0F1-type ATP synthase membrane subunit b/b'